MSSSSPYAPPTLHPEETPLVSIFRVNAFYLGIGIVPAGICAALSMSIGGDAAVIFTLPVLPFAIHLATWRCFRLRWRETPWFLGLFIAVPASCLLIWVLIESLMVILREISFFVEFEATLRWVLRVLPAAGIMVAIDLAVGNQLRQHSSRRDALVAAGVGAFSIASLAIVSPVLDPLLWMLVPQFPDPFETGTVSAAWIFCLLSGMLSTGLAIHRRARREREQEKNADGLGFLRESNEPTH